MQRCIRVFLPGNCENLDIEGGVKVLRARPHHGGYLQVEESNGGFKAEEKGVGGRVVLKDVHSGGTQEDSLECRRVWYQGDLLEDFAVSGRGG